MSSTHSSRGHIHSSKFLKKGHKISTERTDKMATAAEKQKAEGTGTAVETVEFTVDVNGKNVTLTAPADPSDAPMDFMLYTEKEQHFSAFAALIGEAQMARLRAEGANVRQFQDFANAYFEALDLGE